MRAALPWPVALLLGCKGSDRSVAAASALPVEVARARGKVHVTAMTN